MQTFNGTTYVSRHGQEALTALKRAADHIGVTPYMAAFALYVALLNHYSSQDDLVVGTPLASRDDGAFTHTLGYFVNTVPLRFDLRDRPSFVQLVNQVRTTVLGAVDHGLSIRYRVCRLLLHWF